MVVQSLSLLESDLTSSHCSVGDPLPTLADAALEALKSWGFVRVEKSWAKSAMPKGATIDWAMSIEVVAIMFVKAVGAFMDMGFIRACEVLRAKSTGDCSKGPPNEVKAAGPMVVMSEAKACWAKLVLAAMLIQSVSMGFEAIAEGKARPVVCSWCGAMAWVVVVVWRPFCWWAWVVATVFTRRVWWSWWSWWWCWWWVPSCCGGIWAGGSGQVWCERL